MTWEPIIAAAVGGGVGIVGTLSATMLTTRQNDRTRWDDEQAAAVVDLIDVASRLEGWHYRRGRSEQKGEPRAVQQSRAERCEEGVDRLYAVGARARAMVPALSTVDELFDTERRLREVADEGLTGRTATWLSARAEHRTAIRALGAQAGPILGTLKKTRADI
jgi:hypothetical protein